MESRIDVLENQTDIEDNVKIKEKSNAINVIWKHFLERSQGLEREKILKLGSILYHVIFVKNKSVIPR